MKDLDQQVKELIAIAKIGLLYKIKAKLQEEINELEKKVGEDEIPA